MQRQNILHRSATLVLALAIAGGLPERALAEERPQADGRQGNSSRPDILLIMADQFNPRCIACAGDPVIKTPHLDRLAREGALFENCYTNSPVCMPARISLVTGQHPHEHGWWTNFVDRFPPDQVTLFDDLNRAGYCTSQTGKFHYFTDTKLEDFRDQAGYYGGLGLDWADELPGWYASPFHVSAYSDYLIRHGLLDKHLDDARARFLAGQYVPKPSPLGVEEHLDSFVARRSIEFLRSAPKDRPYFHFVSFPGPHSPVDAVGPYAEMYNPAEIPMPPNVSTEARIGKVNYCEKEVRTIRALYYGKISLIDRCVGKLLAALEDRGTLDNTLIIFTSDHGDMMGAHGRFSKVVFYEESARIPLLARWPGHIRPGLKTPVLNTLHDIYATVVDAAGGEMAATAHGKSWLPVCRGETDTLHEAVFSEIGPGNSQNYMVRAGAYKYWKWGGRESLFHLADDPYEQHNLVGRERPEVQRVLREMRQRLAGFLPEKPRNVTRGYKPLFTRIRRGSNAPLPEILKRWRVEWEQAARESRYLQGAVPQPPAIK
jgi:arylsulfatase A-like enzyme